MSGVAAWQNAVPGAGRQLMPPSLNYGPRLTDEEYEKRIVALQSELPSRPSQEEDRAARRRQLELAIDHRLGRDFPADRREALWEVQQRIEKRRLRLAFRYLLRRLAPRLLARGAHSLAGYAVDEYAAVLTEPELRRFLDLREGEQPALPVDLDQIRK